MSKNSILFGAVFGLSLIFCTSSPAQLADGFTEKENFAVKKNIPYVKDGGERQQLDLFLPKDFKNASKSASPKKFPVLLLIHGGGWTEGNKEGVEHAAQQLAPHGIALASMNYRFAPKDVFPAQLNDCKSAIRWLRANAKELNLDPEKIGAWGASAGGHLTALLAVTGKEKAFDVGENLEYSSEIQFGCDFFGPKDFLILAEYPEYDRFGAATDLITNLLGDTPKNKPDLARQASPISYARKDAAPLLILHGTQDVLVPVEQSIDFDRAMKKVGADCELIVLKGSEHGGPEFMNEENMKKIFAFVLKHLADTKTEKP